MSKDIVDKREALSNASQAFSKYIDEIPLGEEWRLRSLCKTLYLQILIKDAKATVEFRPILSRGGVVPVINWGQDD